MTDKDRTLEWERRWATWAGVSAALGVAFLIAYYVLLRDLPRGEVDVEFLQKIDEHRGSNILSGFMELAGLVCFIFPLAYLFRAAAVRMPAVRPRLIGAVVVAPLLIGLAAVMQSILLNSAATDFFASQIPAKMSAANQAASDTVSDQGLRPLVAGLYFGGGIGFAAVMFYTGLFSMRAGLLSRFWGSLGMATGVLTLLFGPVPFAMIWFGYLGLLIADRLPGDRPKAWDAGEAVPWPTPGEKMAAQMDPRGKGDEADSPDGGDVVDTAGRDLGDSSNPPRQRGERRKRKRRD